jgi:hypothetical protein
MNFIHLLFVPFTGLGLYGGFRGKRWLTRRIQIFKNFVLPSLQGQTRKEFTVWMQWRKQEEYSPIVNEFRAFLDKVIGMRFVHTFGGITIWDDKFSDKDAEKKLLESLKKSLPDLKSTIGDAQWIYLTCQPSDDLYSRNAIREIQDTFEKTEFKTNTAVGYKQGYIINYATKELKEYNPETLPPFSTIAYPRDVFLDPRSHYIYSGPYRSHEEVEKCFKFITIPGRGFMVGTHGSNISTTFIHPYAGKELLGDEKDGVLHKFSVYYSDRIYHHKGIRLYGRVIINLLPRPLHNLIKWGYHTLRAKFL